MLLWDDLAKWVIAELRKLGISADDEPGQEDFGWYLNFKIAQTAYSFVVGYREDDETWIGWIERNRGFLSSILGWRTRHLDLAAPEILHAVLSSSNLIDGLRWHFPCDFDRGNEEKAFASPAARQSSVRRGD